MINEPILIKGNLEIEKGTILNFAPKTHMIINGTIDVKGQKFSCENELYRYRFKMEWTLCL